LQPGELRQWVAKTNPKWSVIFAAEIPSESAGQFERRPSAIAGMIHYLLSGTDLTLRGLIGPGRPVRRLLNREGRAPEIREIPATLCVIKMAGIADEVIRGRSLRRDALRVARWPILRAARGLDRFARRLDPDRMRL
jgi:hypothetical protein